MNKWYLFGSLQSHNVWSQLVMGVAGFLELKNLSQKYQVYKVNCPNHEFLCKPLYLFCLNCCCTLNHHFIHFARQFRIIGIWKVWEEVKVLNDVSPQVCDAMGDMGQSIFVSVKTLKQKVHTLPQRIQVLLKRQIKTYLKIRRRSSKQY